MRTHEDIVRAVGATEMARRLNERGVAIASNTPQRWIDRNRIPIEYWSHIVAMKAATDAELRKAYRPRKPYTPRNLDPATA